MTLIRSILVFVGGAAAGWWASNVLRPEEPEDSPSPAPGSAPTPEPASRAEPAPSPVAEVRSGTVRGVVVPDSSALLGRANAASADALAGLGVRAGAIAALLAGRPYADLAALGATKGVGPKTLSALVAAGDGSAAE